MPKVVADRMHEYMQHSFVQLGAGYEVSQRATRIVDEAHDFINLFMNGVQTGEVVLGPSCSVLCRLLADCYAQVLSPGDEVVVAEIGHEANVGPWAALQRHGIEVKLWPVDPQSTRSPLEGLSAVLSDRTRIVAFPHVSNLLGEVMDVASITRLAHEKGARVVVDGVAYAPHRAIDVAAWEVDWYAYSTYKVYGPHMAALYGKHEAFAELTGPNHFFIPGDELPYKFELGGANHEGCSGLLALGDYLRFLAGREPGAPVNRQTVLDAFEVMALCEQPVQEKLIRYLSSKPQLRIVGPETADRSRVGTISFLHEGMPSGRIAEAACARGIGIRNGHMYAHRLCTALGIDPEDGVVRVSLVHYNTPEEIERLIELLEEIV